MNLPILTAMLANLFLAGLAAFYILREARLKKELQLQKRLQQQETYELSLLRKIHESIDYSLNAERVFDVFLGSLGNLYHYSTVSSLIVQNDTLLFKTMAHERISHAFLGRVRNNMLSSLSALSESALPDQIEARLSGVFLDDSNMHSPQSFFHVPLYINKNVVGIISVASSKHHAYTKEHMVLLYKLADHASLILSRIKHALDAEKERIMAVIGSLYDGVMVIDTNHELFVINKKAREFLSITSLHPTLHDVLDSLPETAGFGLLIRKVLSGDEEIQEKEINVGTRTIKLSITPVMGPDGRSRFVIGASVLLRDISLEKSVSKMKEDFTHVIVHELRSPLTAIKAASQLMVAQESKFSPEEKHKLLKLINEQARTLLDEVSLILDAAKLQAGLFTVQSVPGDIKKTIHMALSVFLPQAQSKYVQIIERIPDTLPAFSFDERYIAQVINNLVSNSLKFTPVGGKITVEAGVSDNTLRIRISDTGIGIPKDKQATLFTKFSQVRGPNEKAGTGLGLYIVKGIIEAHGGTVSLESEPAHGTTVSFTLPLTLEKSTGVPKTEEKEYQNASEPHAIAQRLSN